MSLLIFYLFFLGLIIGSFLNVLILRYNTGRSLAGRSGCFSCGHPLSWLELIPVVSFLRQRGHCRHCGSKVSKQYLAVELLAGMLFSLVAWKFYPSLPAIIFYCLVAALFLLIVVHDLRHKIIAEEPAYLLIGLSVLRPFVFRAGDLQSEILMAILSGFVMFAAFFSLWYFSRGRAMGFGDAKLAFAIGALLGFRGALNAIVISFWIGALVGLSLIALSRLRRIRALRRRFSIKSEVPFAPFLALGLLLNLFFGLSVLAF